MRSIGRLMLVLPSGAAQRIRRRRRYLVALAAASFLLFLAAFVWGCGAPRLAYVFVDGEQRSYKLSMIVAERGPGGETVGTVALEALLRLDANVSSKACSACFLTVDYQDAKITTTGSALTSGNQIPRAYFPLYAGRLMTLTEATPRGDGYSVDLARTGPKGALSVMLLNAFVGKCLAEPLRDARHELAVGNQWTTVRQLPGEFMTYLYTGKRPTGGQNKETTRVKVTALAGEGALAELAWSSVTPLQGSRTLDITESLRESGMEGSEIDELTAGELEASVTIAGSCDCSGTASVRMSDGWPVRASVDRMRVDLTYWWSSQTASVGPPSTETRQAWPTIWRIVPSYPDELLASAEAPPVEMILDITGFLEAVS